MTSTLDSPSTSPAVTGVYPFDLVCPGLPFQPVPFEGMLPGETHYLHWESPESRAAPEASLYLDSGFVVCRVGLDAHFGGSGRVLSSVRTAEASAALSSRAWFVRPRLASVTIFSNSSGLNLRRLA